jgi:hypothetical protein
VGTGRGKFDDLMKAAREPQSAEGKSASQFPRTTTGGKRSDSDYRQVSAYIRKDTHQQVKIALLQEEREFSELVEELLRDWLESRT